jgi:hypothetical protein
VIDDAKGWLRNRAGKVLVCSTGALLTVSLLLMGTSPLGGDSAEVGAQAGRLVATLEGDLSKAQGDLKAKHEKLLADLPGVDTERADRDEATGRSVLLSLTDSSASTRDVKRTQALLDARYEFLTPSSRVLTEFIPEWMAAIGSGHGIGTTYTLGALDIDVSSVQGLDYGYIGLARLDPVAIGDRSTATSEYVLFGYSTKQDGTVSSFEACRASSRTRDSFVAAEKQRSGTAGGTATPTPDSAPHTGG